MPIDDFLNLHGIKKLFIKPVYAMLPYKQINSYAENLLFAVLQHPIGGRSENLLQKYLYDLSKIGAFLINTPTPWIETSSMRSARIHFLIKNNFNHPRRKARMLPNDFILK
jgi:hypothetical protein